MGNIIDRLGPWKWDSPKGGGSSCASESLYSINCRWVPVLDAAIYPGADGSLALIAACRHQETSAMAKRVVETLGGPSTVYIGKQVDLLHTEMPDWEQRHLGRQEKIEPLIGLPSSVPGGQQPCLDF
jgi:hypothetical protein